MKIVGKDHEDTEEMPNVRGGQVSGGDGGGEMSVNSDQPLSQPAALFLSLASHIQLTQHRLN